ncbi:MAG TPA: hypothetical protein VMV27_03135 [Candidatus Binataceae bacterium]|nr:hypothetical protein [Candidatus Binataceae bacterium]HVA25536.1 hypothetical protein [Chloroflexota bacterium]
MISQPRRRRGAALAGYATLMLAAWVGLVFVAKSLAEKEATAGFAAFVGFMVLAMSVVTYVLFMMAVDSDKG